MKLEQIGYDSRYQSFLVFLSFDESHLMFQTFQNLFDFKIENLSVSVNFQIPDDVISDEIEKVLASNVECVAEAMVIPGLT